MKQLHGSPNDSNGISRLAIRFVAPVLLSLTVMLVAAVCSIELLSTIRAWVGGESLYSKGQKNATYYLSQYTQSHSEEDYRLYQSAITFPLGDWKARLALQHPPIDMEAVRAGFLEGGSDRADIESIIMVFRLFGALGPVRHAIDIWTEGDSYTLRICALAAQAHPADGVEVPPAELARIRAELHLINGELTPLAARFSATLGNLARTTRTLLILALAIGTGITGFLCIEVTRARVRERDAKERGLARLTELYAALSQTSQLISRVRDRQQLFEELCRICVGPSGLMLAAVGLWRRELSSIEFVAAHGERQSHLTTVRTDFAGAMGEPEALHTPLYTRRSRVLNGADQARREFPSDASFPLMCQNEVVGVLCVFSREEHYFRKDIVELLEQLAMEASFALDSLYRDAERRQQASVMADQNRILNLIASGAELQVILKTLAEFVESQCDGTLCSLVAQNPVGTGVCAGVSPSMPANFDAVAGEAVLEAGEVQRISARPIFGSKDQLLGTLSLYARRGAEAPRPNAQLVGICVNLAGIAIESCQAADRIRHLAHHDDLTGLPNRLLFNYQLHMALARAERAGTAAAVLFLDLDRFKIINDTLGHDAGDTVLRQIASHLRACVRGTDTLARVGGDEFTLLVEHPAEMHDLGAIAQKLLVAMSSPLTINGNVYQLSGSIGIAVYPKDGADGASLLKNADIAMYRAKSSGRNNFQFYSSEINEHSVERLTLENQLRQAVARREFEIHYQPKVDIPTGGIAGAEALVRWRHPQRGLLLPAEFIGVAEEVGLIGSIGSFVLETVCTDIVRWREGGYPAPRVAMNLSAQQFADSRLLDNLHQVLQRTGCDPRLLEFEITESVVMTNPGKALQLLEQIKIHGITLAIDDFGTGHSSLAYLKRFPVDSVKIDYTFVRDMAVDPDDVAIIKAIIALGHSLNLKIVAEGVESATQLEILRRFQCDEFQGFLFSEAVPAERFEVFLANGVRPQPAVSGQAPRRAAR
ncbi:MAG TPA: EAL domain-containing protein [Steroidobacteraceae bacterium]|nr:EAL domain-containing protein [Steroidobacteraceae bacterium]